MQRIDVAIIGAGPYGLSLAAHLAALGVDYCVFGPSMAFWRENMPPGRLLKSDGNASDLPAPDAFPIREFLTARGVTFRAEEPIPVEHFHDYGMAFHERHVSSCDTRLVARICRADDGFRLTLDDGTAVAARRAVVAVGVRPFAYTPAEYLALPAERISHSVRYGSVAALAGCRVAVIGSGASAIDVASALNEAGAFPIIVSRRARIAFHAPPCKRKLRHRIRRPDTGIGGGWDLWLFANFPHAFHALPETTRLHLIETTLGAAPGWFMRKKIEGQVPTLTGVTTERIAMEGEKIVFDLVDRAGTKSCLKVDHVVAATGFRPDIGRLDFLDPTLRAAIRTAGTAPALSRRFETTMPGLFMIGPVAAPSFGPVMRFVFGAGKTTAPLATHLAGRQARAKAAPTTLAVATCLGEWEG